MWQVSISTANEAEEAVAYLLGEIFQTPGSVYCDARTGRTVVTVYVERLRRPSHLVRLDLMRQFRTLARKVTIKKLRRENWAESWKRHFHPLEIGRALLIKPSWSKRRAVKGQRVVVLDPGLSFGTGHHATTAFCLRKLARCRKAGQTQSFLDIGTGSGILAIAAAKLGYSPVHAFDFDPESVRVSRINVSKNRVGDRVKPKRLDLTWLPIRSKERYDVICANLTEDLLRSEAEKICGRLKPEGQLILAGILRSQFSRVQKTFSKLGLKLSASRSEMEWQSGQFAFRHRLSGVRAAGEKGV